VKKEKVSKRKPIKLVKSKQAKSNSKAKAKDQEDENKL